MMLSRIRSLHQRFSNLNTAASGACSDDQLSTFDEWAEAIVDEANNTLIELDMPHLASLIVSSANELRPSGILGLKITQIVNADGHMRFDVEFHLIKVAFCALGLAAEALGRLLVDTRQNVDWHARECECDDFKRQLERIDRRISELKSGQSCRVQKSITGDPLTREDVLDGLQEMRNEIYAKWKNLNHLLRSRKNRRPF